MPNSLYQDIRSALQTRANTATGIPTSVAYEGAVFRPVVGTAYVAYSLIPTSDRPLSIGPAGEILMQGRFQIGLFYPTGGGTGTAEAVADAVKAKFVPGDVLTVGQAKVRVRFCERGQIITAGAGFFQVPVTVTYDLQTPTTPTA